MASSTTCCCWLHLVAAPVKLLNTRFSVCLAMVHVLLPFMVLPIYATCARSIGGWCGRRSRWAPRRGRRCARSCCRCRGPASAPASRLVFTLSIGFYITPVLVGAPSDVMVSMLINDQVGLLAWPIASAMSAVLLRAGAAGHRGAGAADRRAAGRRVGR